MGDLSLVDSSFSQTDPEPFLVFYDEELNSVVFSTADTAADRIIGLFNGEEQIKKIDKKFIPNDITAEADWLAQ